MWGKKKPRSLLEEAISRLPKPEPQWKKSLRSVAENIRMFGTYIADLSFGVRCAFRAGERPWKNKDSFLAVLDASAWTSDTLRDLTGKIGYIRNGAGNDQFIQEWNTAQRSALAPGKQRSLSEIFSRYAAAVDTVIESEKAADQQAQDRVTERGINNWREYWHVREAQDRRFSRLREFQDVSSGLNLLAHKTGRIPESSQSTLFSMAQRKMEKAGLLPAGYKP